MQDPEYDSLIQMLSDQNLGWPGAILAARGISAYGKAQIWMVDEGKFYFDTMFLAGLMIEFGEAWEKISIIWGEYNQNSLSREDFLLELDNIISYIESWPANAMERISGN